MWDLTILGNRVFVECWVQHKEGAQGWEGGEPPVRICGIVSLSTNDLPRCPCTTRIPGLRRSHLTYTVPYGTIRGGMQLQCALLCVGDTMCSPAAPYGAQYFTLLAISRFHVSYIYFTYHIWCHMIQSWRAIRAPCVGRGGQGHVRAWVVFGWWGSADCYK